MDQARKKMLLINLVALASSAIALAASYYFLAQNQAKRQPSVQTPVQAAARR